MGYHKPSRDLLIIGVGPGHLVSLGECIPETQRSGVRHDAGLGELVMSLNPQWYSKEKNCLIEGPTSGRLEFDIQVLIERQPAMIPANELLTQL